MITRVESALSIFALIFASNLSSRIVAIFAAMSSVFNAAVGVDTVETDGVFSCTVVSFFCFFVCVLSDSSENSAVLSTAMLLRRCQAFYNGRLIGSGCVRAFCIAHFAASVRSSPWGFPPYVWTSLSMWLETSFDVRLPFVRCTLIPSNMAYFIALMCSCISISFLSRRNPVVSYMFVLVMMNHRPLESVCAVGWIEINALLGSLR